MSQVEKTKCAKEQKKVKGWSTEEMKEKPSSSLEEDTEEKKTWRGMSQDELGQCWGRLAERMEEEVLDKYNVEDSKREAFKGRSAHLGWRRGAQKQERQNQKVERRQLGQNLRLVQRTQLAATAKQVG